MYTGLERSFVLKREAQDLWLHYATILFFLSRTDFNLFEQSPVQSSFISAVTNCTNEKTDTFSNKDYYSSIKHFTIIWIYFFSCCHWFSSGMSV